MSLQIYSEYKTNRLEYILNVIFSQILSVEYSLITHLNALNTEQPTLNYSSQFIENAIQIKPHTLLFETEIQQQDIRVENNYYFFRTNNTGIQFDIFASSFYMISRYEEYFPSKLDSHLRFCAENSLAYKSHFLEKAVVNRWALELKTQLLKQFPNLTIKTSSYQFLSTIDIDNAFAFKAKNPIRLIGGFIKALIRADFEDIKARISYLIFNKKDPFDVYDYISSLHQKNQIKTVFFFLVGKNTRYDKNIKISNTHYQNLIQKIAQESLIGIHPSYYSNANINILQSEINSLQSLVNKNITISRQHFLKLTLPDSYKKLLQLNIKEDYTMGFASQVGFRAGICTPFLWFDLEENKSTDLKIIPFQVMDGTLNQYLKLKPKEALNLIESIKKEVKSVNGLFVTLWHNESLSEIREWKGWRTVYEQMISL